MKRVRMTETVEGALQGDVVGYENEGLADALVAGGKAVNVTWDADKKEYVDVPNQPGA